VSEFDELRALVREVIRDVLPNGLPVIETVDLSTNEDLAAFVAKLLDLEPGEREDLQTGRKRFRLAAVATPAPVPGRPPAQPSGPAAGPVSSGAPVRRVESGAVTEALVKQAALAGERLVLGRGAVLTPLARDRARASGVEITKER
jgi:hypothetical protein